MGIGKQPNPSTTLLSTHTTNSFSLKLLFTAMADFFTSSVAAVAAESAQETKTVSPPPTDKADRETITTTNNAGSNFSMCEIIM
ncbi:unnamed protein product [Rhizoctonia solani]|uniref:Uncharacterized protein n=2 Tax=Rhizoctonia solani TaxID=456999 RepID=A0A8H2XED8_9AGAM|nr:hypothetical protein RSOL_490940 [Rhizoctonia solani AG-3 Rhs1AP]CAE6421614.1 unnamed protein product [Rhizoctonia solani]